MIEPSIIRCDVVDSTNNIARNLAMHKAPEGTVVAARSQRKGRGRLGRTWYDEPGGSLLLSVVLRPDVPKKRLPELSFVAGVAMAEWLGTLFLDLVELKWPNDLMVASRKIGGILVETTFSSEETWAVIGIGVNVNQTTFPPEIADSATSIRIITGASHEVDALLPSVARAVLDRYEQYLANGFEEIVLYWRKYMWGLGKQASVRIANSILSGAILGIDDDGSLLMQDETGAYVHLRAADSLRLI
jgi:BirA family biotin operon repressor/biotin-[acetyl-CoA-carboxylase] ligase